MPKKRKIRIRLNDEFFRKSFIGLVTLALMLTLSLGLHILFGVPLSSRPMWLTLGILFIGINVFYSIHRLWGRVITLLVVVTGMALIFVKMLNWSLVPSFQIGLVSFALLILLYMTFISG